MVEITIVDKEEEWKEIVTSFEYSDFYHTYAYHNISKNENEHPFLVLYEEGIKSIALPLLLREIPGSCKKDATSVYGYAGPLTKNLDQTFNNFTFTKEIQKLFREMNVVSVFSRLNPFIPNQNIALKNLGSVTNIGKIVNIDITHDLDTQKKLYNRRLKSYINKSRLLYSVKLLESSSDLDVFINLYYENMRRVNAKRDYFFSKRYFIELFNSKDFKTEILLAIHNKTNKIIAGAMFIKKNNIVQYHLSGSDERYLNLNPIKMLIDEMRIRASQENYQYFNLGGGLGSCEDSLFQFKSLFSKDFKAFEVWKYIVDIPTYNQLSSETMKKGATSVHNCSHNYFPSYRCTSKEQNLKK